MKLIPDSKRAHKLWSIRLAVIASGLAAAEASLPLWEGVVPGGAFAGLSSIVGIAAAVARVVHQEGFS